MGNYLFKTPNVQIVNSKIEKINKIETETKTENFSLEENLADNDKSLGNINVQLNESDQMEFYDSLGDEHLASSSSELKNKVSDTIKLLNNSEEVLLKARYSREEKKL